MSRREARALVDETLEEIAVALLQDGVVLLSGFGKFEVRRKAARVGRNPKTGEEHEITPRRSVVFKPSSLLRSKVSGATDDASDDRRSADVGTSRSMPRSLCQAAISSLERLATTAAMGSRGDERGASAVT